MSRLTDVAVRASIEDFTKARDKTLRLLNEGRRLCDMARECSEKHVRYGFPHEAMPAAGTPEGSDTRRYPDLLPEPGLFPPP